MVLLMAANKSTESDYSVRQEMLRHKVYWFLHVHNELIINILPLSHYFFYTEQKFMFKEIKNIATVHKLKVRRVAVCERFIKQQTSSSHESYPLLHVTK